MLLVGVVDVLDLRIRHLRDQILVRAFAVLGLDREPSLLFVLAEGFRLDLLVRPEAGRHREGRTSEACREAEWLDRRHLAPLEAYHQLAGRQVRVGLEDELEGVIPSISSYVWRIGLFQQGVRYREGHLYKRYTLRHIGVYSWNCSELPDFF